MSAACDSVDLIVSSAGFISAADQYAPPPSSTEAEGKHNELPCVNKSCLLQRRTSLVGSSVCMWGLVDVLAVVSLGCQVSRVVKFAREPSDTRREVVNRIVERARDAPINTRDGVLGELKAKRLQ